MQLQKLVFFAHGVHLANEKGSLIKERFETWQQKPDESKLCFPDGVMITFLTTTTANTLAFLSIIFRYLFSRTGHA